MMTPKTAAGVLTRAYRMDIPYIFVETNFSYAEEAIGNTLTSRTKWNELNSSVTVLTDRGRV